MEVWSLQERAYRDWVLHLRIWEHRVDVEVPVIRHDWSGLSLRHTEGGFDGADGCEGAQDVGVGEGDDFDWDALFPLVSGVKTGND